MTVIQLRNRLISLLWDAMGCPIVLADQVQPEAPVPFGIYSITAPYIPEGGMGDYAARPDDGDVRISRREMPTATFSFTFCSQDREGPDGVPVSGADEVQELADRAIGWFLHTGYDAISAFGITVVEVGQAQDRTTLLVDEASRRVGFDVLVRYTRVDTRNVSAIEMIKLAQKRE